MHVGIGWRHAPGDVGAAGPAVVGCGGSCESSGALMHPGCTIDQVYLYREPIDFRKAIDGLSALVELELGLSPFASALYVCSILSRNKITARHVSLNCCLLWQTRL